MRFLLLIHTDPELMAALPSDEFDRLMHGCITHADALEAEGRLIGSQQLEDASTARTLRVRDGALRVTDGPFAETKEFLAGYWIVDVESPERAYRIAAEASMAPGPGGKPLHLAIEVRQVMSAPPTEQG